MKIQESKVGKVCIEQDQNKYLPIVSEPIGYAKLCCYTVKLLHDNDIFASYENICVALWIMFPKCERLHLAGYDNMPDTDYMEKVIKLRSTPKNQNYLTGGNFQGKTSEHGYEWRLNGKGELFAKEVEEILAGGTVATRSRNAAKEKSYTGAGGSNYESELRHMWASKLWNRFMSGDSLDKISGPEVASALDLLYSSSRFADDVKERKRYYEAYLNRVENQGVPDERFALTREFLKKLQYRGGESK